MNIEREKKFLLQNYSNEDIELLISSEFYENKSIEQYYLDLDSGLVQRAIEECFNKETLTNAKEARVRVINGHKYIFTVKGSGNIERIECEFMLEKGEAYYLISQASTGVVKKNRTCIPTKLGVVEIDYYKNRNLVVAEMEYDNTKVSDEEVYNAVDGIVKAINPNINIIDITKNAKYKNRNLAQEIEKE